MEVDYRLAETVVVVEGTIDVVSDEKLGTIDEDDWGSVVTNVAVATRGDEGGGAQTVRFDGGRGSDDDFTVEFTADLRLASVSYKSVGVGSRLVAATTTLIATIAGTAVRVAAGRAGTIQTATVDEARARADAVQTAEDAARAEWDGNNEQLAAHKNAYKQVLADARAKLLKSRQELVAATTADDMSAATARIYRLGSVEGAAQAEIDKVDAIYRVWRDSFTTRRKETKSYIISMAGLPRRARDTAPDPNALSSTAKAAWDELGVIVEVGPADGYGSTMPTPPTSNADGSDRRVYWRVPRPVRLWVWQRGPNGTPELVRTQQAMVVNEHSTTRSMLLSSKVFGEQGGALVFDESGAVTKISRNDKSALGAFADAIGAIPATVAAGFDSVSKAEASLSGLADADAKRNLDAIKREVERRKLELEQRGLDATAGEVAELKRLQQQVELQTARDSLAPPTTSELTELQHALALEATRKELEATTRQRALDGELAAAEAEIARLTVELSRANLERETKNLERKTK